MKTKTLLLLLLTTSFSLDPNVAQAGTEPESNASRLSLNDVTRIVLERNPAIRESMRRWEGARQRVTQQGAWDDLRISTSTKVRRYVDVPPNAFTDQMVSVEQVVPISGKNRVHARIAAAEAVAVFEEVRRQQFDVLAKARSAYFRLANAYAQIELNRKNYTSLRQIADIGASRYEVGTQSAADVLTSETESAKLLEMRRDLDRNVANAQSQLNVLMNRDAFAGVAAAGDFSPPHIDLSPEKLRRITLTDRPEVRTASARLEAEKSKLQLARRAWIPDPSLKLEGQRYNEAGQSLSELDAGISFNVPWPNARKYSAGVNEAVADVAAAEAALERNRADAIGALRDALQKVETAHHHVELFGTKLIPQARQAFEASQFAYESGKATFGEWIAAQRNLRDLEAEAREHLTDYQVALAELEAVTGSDLHIFSSTQNHNTK
jgi:outer membrane protein TolC